jgi:hypothetical protein
MAAKDFALKQQAGQFQLSQAQEAAAKQKADAKRAEEIIAARMQGVDPNDPRAVARALNATLPDLVGAGLTDPYRSLSGYLAANNALLQPEKKPGMDVRVVDNVKGEDGKPYQVWYDNDSGKEVRRIPQYVKPDAPKGRYTETQEQALYTRLSNDFQKRIAQAEKAGIHVRSANASRQAALTGSPIAQHNLILSMFHIKEPESIVREGEFARVGEAYGFSKRVNLALQRVDNGGFLTPDMTRDILAEVDRLEKEHRRTVQEAKRQIDSRAKKAGLDSDLITFDPFDLPEFNEGTTPTQPASRSSSTYGP